jgi:hypothetical protein
MLNYFIFFAHYIIKTIMGTITNAIMAVPIGVMYNMIIHEFSKIVNHKASYDNKIQKNLLIIFGGGLFGFIAATFLLADSDNKALKFGLYIGSVLLMLHSIVYNWKVMQNDTRIIIMVLTLGTLIWYSYSKEYKKPKGKKIAKMVNGVYKNTKNQITESELDEFYPN